MGAVSRGEAVEAPGGSAGWKRRNEARSSNASASLTSDRSCQIASSSALNIAGGGHARPPLEDG